MHALFLYVQRGPLFVGHFWLHKPIDSLPIFTDKKSFEKGSELGNFVVMS